MFTYRNPLLSPLLQNNCHPRDGVGVIELHCVFLSDVRLATGMPTVTTQLICTIHSISALPGQEKKSCSQAKDQLSSYCLLYSLHIYCYWSIECRQNRSVFPLFHQSESTRLIFLPNILVACFLASVDFEAALPSAMHHHRAIQDLNSS